MGRRHATAARRAARAPAAAAVSDVQFSPDGTSWPPPATTRRCGCGTCTRRPLGRPLSGHTGTVCGVAFSPDGKTLASAGDERRCGCGTSGPPSARPTARGPRGRGQQRRVQPRTAARWPAEATTRPYGCGASRPSPARGPGHGDRRAAAAGLQPGRRRPRRGVQPARRAPGQRGRARARSSSGTCARGRPLSRPLEGHAAGSAASHSSPAARSPPPASTGRCGCGTPGPGRPLGRARPSGPPLAVAGEPGRAYARRRRRATARVRLWDARTGAGSAGRSGATAAP